MALLLKLFYMFTKLSAFSFGGGYVMIPILIREAEKYGWASPVELIDVVAIAGMSPGPVAINAAVALGYRVASYPGIPASLLGITIPCATIVVLVAVFFRKIHQHKLTQAVLYGLKAVTPGIICFAAAQFAIQNGMVLATAGGGIKGGSYFTVFGCNLLEIKSISILLFSLLVLLRTSFHPIYLIISAGILGVVLF